MIRKSALYNRDQKSENKNESSLPMIANRSCTVFKSESEQKRIKIKYLEPSEIISPNKNKTISNEINENKSLLINLEQKEELSKIEN